MSIGFDEYDSVLLLSVFPYLVQLYGLDTVVKFMHGIASDKQLFFETQLLGL